MPWGTDGALPDPHGVLPRLRRLLEVRRGLPALHAAARTEALEPSDTGVFHVLRHHPLGPLLELHNMTDHETRVPLDLVRAVGLDPHQLHDHLADGPPRIHDGHVVLAPYAASWLT